MFIRKEFQVSLILIILLGLGLVYVSYQQNSLQERVDQLDYLVIEAEIEIDNGSGVIQKEVHMTRGATAYEALERTASVGTNYYPGVGKYITRINGVSNNRENGKYWLVAKWENNNWKGLNVGADSYRLKNGDNILFWYGKSGNAPFEF